jgi:hypothetical protein
MAEALAQAWLCTDPQPDGACGFCRPCEAFGRGRSSDLLKIAPQGPSDWIRTVAITPESQSTEPDPPLSLIEFLRTRQLMSRHKVVIISRIDRLYPSAANALLKTLEEPHPYAKIVATTSEIGRVIPTILSRCVCVACELPERGHVHELFDNALPDLIELAEGAPGRLSHILRHSEPYTKVVNFARRLGSAPAPAYALTLSEDFRKICDELEDTLNVNARAANVEGLRVLGAALRSVTDRPDWLQAVAEAHRRVQGNGNESMVLDAMFARMLLGK